MKATRNTNKSISIGNYSIRQYLSQVDNSRPYGTKHNQYAVVLFKGNKKIKQSNWNTKKDSNRCVRHLESLLKDSCCA